MLCLAWVHRCNSAVSWKHRGKVVLVVCTLLYSADVLQWVGGQMISSTFILSKWVLFCNLIPTSNFDMVYLTYFFLSYNWSPLPLFLSLSLHVPRIPGSICSWPFRVPIALFSLPCPPFSACFRLPPTEPQFQEGHPKEGKVYTIPGPALLSPLTAHNLVLFSLPPWCLSELSQRLLSWLFFSETHMPRGPRLVGATRGSQNLV